MKNYELKNLKYLEKKLKSSNKKFLFYQNLLKYSGLTSEEYQSICGKMDNIVNKNKQIVEKIKNIISLNKDIK